LRTRRRDNRSTFLDWRARNRSFTGLTGFRESGVTFLSGDRPERLTGAMVNANFFDILEVRAALGRTFRSSDETPGADRVAVISDALWRERFGGARDIVGRTVRFDAERYTIVGVMPPGIDYPGRAQVWVSPHWAVPDDPLLPPSQDPSADRSHGYFFALGRLKPAVTYAAAVADMDAVAVALAREYPDTNRNVGAALTPLRNDLVGTQLRSTTLLLFAAVGVLLLIATANVSGLLMARATARHQEVAVRLALGAAPGRVLAQLLTESVLLAIVGGAAGVLLAMWMVAALVRFSPADLTVAGDIRIDTTVLMFRLEKSTEAGLFV
jgi:predicted permease